MPEHFQRKYRLGEATYDPVLKSKVWHHVFEVVDAGDNEEQSKGTESQIKMLEGMLERMRKANKS